MGIPSQLGPLGSNRAGPFLLAALKKKLHRRFYSRVIKADRGFGQDHRDGAHQRAGVSHVREFMTLAKTEAEAGSRVAGRASEAMHDIETSSKQIGQIIRVIEEISHQTNLLALNAAVEAARAGESGRGFGIVATEVRALAKRSATAADQIKTLVAISRADVGKGVALVAETGTVLDRMLSQVADISVVVTLIADDAQHQSSSLHDLNMAMRDIDRAARESNVVIENANAASRALAAETSDLNALIGSFALNAQQVAA
jgi:methyl-accepting chemotaxis protein